MIDKRKKEDVVTLQTQKQKWDEGNPSHVGVKQPVSEYYVNNPKHTSIKGVKQEQSMLNR